VKKGFDETTSGASEEITLVVGGVEVQ